MWYNTAVMKKYKYILFDLDGTLIYSHPGIYACFHHALKEIGWSSPTPEQLRLCIGPSLMYSFQNYYGMDEATAWKATQIYREEYGRTGVWQNEPIEGALELLRDLKSAGYGLAMATSKPEKYAKQISERFGFSEYFSAQTGCGFDGSFPTKASVIEETMRRAGAKAEDCLMVGDRKHDAEGAKEMGVDCALLKIGYAESADEYERANPDYIFENFAQLKKFLIK